MTEAGAFRVHSLARQQRCLALQFGGGVADLEERLEGVAHSLGELGSPLLEGCLASLECRIQGTLPGGTHTVVVGEVTAWDIDPGKSPLLYWRREFRFFGEDSK